MRLLDSFRPKLFVELGLSADWGEEFVSLIRKLEPEDYDLSRLREDVRAWFARQKHLFQDLRVLDELDAGSGHQTNTWCVIKNAMECPPLSINGRSFHLWSATRGDKEVFCQVAQSMSNLVEASVARIEAELLSGPQADWDSFSMRLWHNSQSFAPDDQHTFQQILKKKLTRLCQLAHVDPAAGVRQFFQAVHIIYDIYKAEVKIGRNPDNRDLWRVVFKPELARRVNGSHELPELSIPVMDSEANDFPFYQGGSVLLSIKRTRKE